MKKVTEQLKKAEDFFLLSGFDQFANEKQQETQLSCIEEEFYELLDAANEPDNEFNNCNTTAERDALADLIVTIVGYSLMRGYDLEQDLTAVNESNFSKFDISKNDAELTVKKYKDIGVTAEYKKVGGYFITLCSKNCADNNEKKYPAGKILKSINYKEPDIK